MTRSLDDVDSLFELVRRFVVLRSADGKDAAVCLADIPQPVAL
jgi:hypothetical protein